MARVDWRPGVRGVFELLYGPRNARRTTRAACRRGAEGGARRAATGAVGPVFPQHDAARHDQTARAAAQEEGRTAATRDPTPSERRASFKNGRVMASWWRFEAASTACLVVAPSSAKGTARTSRPHPRGGGESVLVLDAATVIGRATTKLLKISCARACCASSSCASARRGEAPRRAARRRARRRRRAAGRARRGLRKRQAASAPVVEKEAVGRRARGRGRRRRPPASAKGASPSAQRAAEAERLAQEREEKARLAQARLERPRGESGASRPAGRGGGAPGGRRRGAPGRARGRSATARTKEAFAAVVRVQAAWRPRRRRPWAWPRARPALQSALRGGGGREAARKRAAKEQAKRDPAGPRGRRRRPRRAWRPRRPSGSGRRSKRAARRGRGAPRGRGGAARRTTPRPRPRGRRPVRAAAGARGRRGGRAEAEAEAARRRGGPRLAGAERGPGTGLRVGRRRRRRLRRCAGGRRGRARRGGAPAVPPAAGPPSATAATGTGLTADDDAAPGPRGDEIGARRTGHWPRGNGGGAPRARIRGRRAADSSGVRPQPFRPVAISIAATRRGARRAPPPPLACLQSVLAPAWRRPIQSGCAFMRSSTFWRGASIMASSAPRRPSSRWPTLRAAGHDGAPAALLVRQHEVQALKSWKSFNVSVPSADSSRRPCRRRRSCRRACRRTRRRASSMAMFEEPLRVPLEALGQVLP